MGSMQAREAMNRLGIRSGLGLGTALILTLAIASAHARPTVEWDAEFPDPETAISSAYPDGAGGYILTGYGKGGGRIARIDGQGARLWDRLADSAAIGPATYLGPSGAGWAFRGGANLLAVDAGGKTLSWLAGAGDGDWGPDETYLYCATGTGGARSILKIRADGLPVWERLLEDTLPPRARFVNGPRGAWVLTSDARLRRLDRAGKPTADQVIPFLTEGQAYFSPTGAELASGDLAVWSLNAGDGHLSFARIDTSGRLAASAAYDLGRYFDLSANGYLEMRSAQEKDGTIALAMKAGKTAAVFRLDSSTGALVGAPAYPPNLPDLTGQRGVALDAAGRWIYWGRAPDSAGRRPVYSGSGSWIPDDFRIPVIGTVGANGEWLLSRLEEYRDTSWYSPLAPGMNCLCSDFREPIGAQALLPTPDGGALLLGNFHKAGAPGPGAVGVLKLAPGLSDAIAPRKPARARAKPTAIGGRVDAAGRKRSAGRTFTFPASVLFPAR